MLEFFCSNCWNFSIPILSLVRSPARGLSCPWGLFCPCRQRGLFCPCWHCCLDLLLAFWSSGLLACLTSGLPTAFWPRLGLSCPLRLGLGPLVPCLCLYDVSVWSTARLFSSAYSTMQGSCLILVYRLSVCFGSPCIGAAFALSDISGCSFRLEQNFGLQLSP